MGRDGCAGLRCNLHRSWTGDGGPGRVGFGLEEGDFVGEDEVGDGEVVAICFGYKLRRAGEGVRKSSAGAGERGVGMELLGGDDEAAADGEEDLFAEEPAFGVEGAEAQAVGMGGGARVGVHPVAAEEEVFGLAEGDGVGAGEREGAGVADPGQADVDGGWIECVGGAAGEAEEDGAVGRVAEAGEGE